MVKRKEQDTDKRQRQLCLLERSCIDLLPKHQQLNPADSNTMNRDDSVFSGVSQTQEDKCHMTSLTLGVLMQKLGADKLGSEARSSVQLHGRVSKFNNNVGQKKGL